jgi:hypothetical protein
MRFFTGFLIAIGLIVLLFVSILKSGGSGIAPFNLNSYANTGAVTQLTIRGPITANQTFQSVVITVGATQVNFQILQGYNGSVQTSQSFENNQTGYTTFLHALTFTGFPEGSKEAKYNDYLGYCATGEQYIFNLQENSSNILQFWSTTCGSQGSFRGNPGAAVALFQAQVPNYTTLTANLPF